MASRARNSRVGVAVVVVGRRNRVALFARAVFVTAYEMVVAKNRLRGEVCVSLLPAVWW